MKRILVIVLAVILALALSMTSVTFAAGGKKEVQLAQEAGQAWLDGVVASTGEPMEWVDARLTTVQVYYDLKGKPDAYNFAIENNGEVVGYIVVGSSDYGYDMFEAGDVPPLSIPSADTVKSILKRDFGLNVASIGSPTRLLYLGFDNLFAVYQAGGQELAVNVPFAFAIPASNLTAIATMPSPEEYKANKELANPIPMAYPSYWFLYMKAVCNTYCNQCISGKCACGPASGASIADYYKNWHTPNYSNFPAGCTMYSKLWDYMLTRCSDGWTAIANYGPGFVQMAAYYGYTNFWSSTPVQWPNSAYYDNQVKYYITNGWPIAMCAWRFYDDISYPNNPNFPPPTSHFVAIRGYYDGWHNYSRVVICTDSYSMSNNLYLNWDFCGIDRWVCAIGE